jgi:thioredoxin-like negative regulator of GroEL
VFTPGAHPGHDVPQRQHAGVQRRIGKVGADPEVLHKRSKGNVEKISTEEEFSALHGSGEDGVVMLTFPWCKSCKLFMPAFEKLAKIYKDTQFSLICGSDNDFTKHYAREVLNVQLCPMFALYTDGKLVKTWTGDSPEEFVKNVEQVPTAKGRMRQALIDAGYA